MIQNTLNNFNKGSIVCLFFICNVCISLFANNRAPFLTPIAILFHHWSLFASFLGRGSQIMFETKV